MPQGQSFSDEDIQQLANDPLFNDADFRRLSEGDRVRYLKAKGGKPVDGQFKLGPSLPPSAGEPMNPFGHIAKVPGKYESLLSMPASVVGAVPMLRGLSIPAAAVLGGAGSVLDDLSEGNGLELGSFIGGAGRQGALQATGDLLAGPTAKLTMGAAMPGAERRAVEAALETGAGTNLNKAYGAAKSVGNEISNRVAQLPDIGAAPDALLEGAPDLVAKTMRRSAKPLSTKNAMETEIDDIAKQTPDVLSAADVLEKKRGAREGYEALLNKQVKNAPVSPPSKVQELYGNNAQKILESLDQAAYKPNAFEDSLGDINKRAGGIQSLIEYLSSRGDRNAMDGLLPRFFLGTLLGAAPGYAMGDGMERYGPMGIAGGAALGLAPATTARILQLLGRSVPPVARGTTAIVGMQRRKPQDNQQ